MKQSFSIGIIGQSDGDCDRVELGRRLVKLVEEFVPAVEGCGVFVSSTEVSVSPVEIQVGVTVHLGVDRGDTPLCFAAQEESQQWSDDPEFFAKVLAFDTESAEFELIRSHLDERPLEPGQQWCGQCELVRDYVQGQR